MTGNKCPGTRVTLKPISSYAFEVLKSATEMTLVAWS